MNENELAVQIVDAALAVHKALGPGLLESIYVAAMEIELADRGLHYEREVIIHATYRERARPRSHRRP